VGEKDQKLFFKASLSNEEEVRKEVLRNDALDVESTATLAVHH